MPQHEINTNGLGNQKSDLDAKLKQVYLQYGGKEEHFDFANEVSGRMLCKDRDGVILTINTAQGIIPDEVIVSTVKRFAEEAEFSLDGLNEETHLELEEFKEGKLMKANKDTNKIVAWVKYPMIPRGFFIVISGETEVGKTRSFASLMAPILKDPNNDLNRMLIISDENPFKEVLSPLICQLGGEEHIFYMDADDIIPRSLGSGNEAMAEEYLSTLENLIIKHKLDILHIDPMPSFFNWLAESSGMVTRGLQDLAEKHNIVIAGVRNDAKMSEVSDKQKPKGNATPFSDKPRMIIRVAECGADSILEKEVKGDAIVWYHAKNSLGLKSGLLFKKDVRGLKGKEEIIVATYKLVRNLKNKEVKVIKTLTGSAENISNIARLMALLKEYPRGLTYTEIAEHNIMPKNSVGITIKRLLTKGDITKGADGRFVVIIEDEDASSQNNQPQHNSSPKTMSLVTPTF